LADSPSKTNRRRRSGVIAVLILWSVVVLTLATMGVIATAAGWQGAPLVFSYAALAIGSVGVVLAVILVLAKRR
jgi:hypothetical protein